MRLSGREMVFHKLEIRSKATNAAEIKSKSIRGSVKTPEFVSGGAVQPRDLVVLSPDGDSEAGCGKAILNFDLKRV